MLEKAAGGFVFLTLGLEGVATGLYLAARYDLTGTSIAICIMVGVLCGFGAFGKVLEYYEDSTAKGVLSYVAAIPILPIVSYFVFYLVFFIIFVINMLGGLIGIVGFGNAMILLLFAGCILYILSRAVFVIFF